MKELGITFLLVLLSLGSLWSQSWDTVQKMTTQELWIESLNLSSNLVDLSEISFQDYLTLKGDLTALTKQLTTLETFNLELTVQLRDLRKEVIRLETVAQTSVSQQIVSTELTENLKQDLKKLKRNNIVLIIGGSVLVTGLVISLGFALFGG